MYWLYSSFKSIVFHIIVDHTTSLSLRKGYGIYLCWDTSVSECISFGVSATFCANKHNGAQMININATFLISFVKKES